MNEPLIGTIDFFDHVPSKEEKIEVREFYFFFMKGMSTKIPNSC